MNHQVNPADERKLTNAIESAAFVATVHPDKDRNQLLATELLDKGVDSRFAKVASAAFNKRLSVLTFQKTPEDKRCDSFPLSDAATVHALMGGIEPGFQVKTASIVQEPFYIATVSNQPPMQKVATQAVAVVPKKPLYEKSISIDTFMNQIKGMMQKHASRWEVLISTRRNLANDIERRKDELKDTLSKVASFTFKTLCNVYGDRFKATFQNLLPDKDFTKTARAVNPHDKLSTKVKNFMDDMDLFVKYHNALVDYQDALTEFRKTASDLGADMVKLAIAAPIAGTAIRNLTLAGMTGVDALEAVRHAATNSAVSGFSNIQNMYNATEPEHMRPDKLLDSNFLTKDRYRDRLIAWSDMSADPLFANYPSEQVFMATQKAMNVSPTMERADNRELLRATVGRLLAQNNRENEAGIASTGMILKTLNEGPRGAAQEARALVSLMDKEVAPTKVDVASILSTTLPTTNMIGSSRDYAAAVSAANKQEWDDWVKEKKEQKKQRDADEKAKEEEENKILKEKSQAKLDSAKIQESIKEKQQQRLANRYKRFQSWVKRIGFEENLSNPGNYILALPNQPIRQMSEQDVLDLFDKWESNKFNP